MSFKFDALISTDLRFQRINHSQTGFKTAVAMTVISRGANYSNPH